MLLPRFVPGRPAGWYAALGQRVFDAALVLLLVLSEVFSSNIQSTLPAFSHAARLTLTGGAALLLAVKLLLLTDYAARWQPAAVLAVLGYTGAAALHGSDRWFFLAALVGLAAYDVDLRRSLRVYLVTAAAGLLLVQLLHLCTPLVPYILYFRNYDFGYGHYNGYGARLLGVVLAWAWLRFDRLRWWEWAGLGAIALYAGITVTARGAAGAMLILLLLLAVHRLWPRLFRAPLLRYGTAAVWPALTALSLWASTWWSLAGPDGVPPWLQELDWKLSARLSIWYKSFLHAPLSLWGGLPTDLGAAAAVDNTYLALIMNKGIVGAVLVGAGAMALLWRLGRRGHTRELVLALAVMAYLVMENKPFLLSADPLVLLGSCLLAPHGAPLNVPSDP